MAVAVVATAEAVVVVVVMVVMVAIALRLRETAVMAAVMALESVSTETQGQEGILEGSWEEIHLGIQVGTGKGLSHPTSRVAQSARVGRGAGRCAGVRGGARGNESMISQGRVPGMTSRGGCRGRIREGTRVAGHCNRANFSSPTTTMVAAAVVVAVVVAAGVVAVVVVAVVVSGWGTASRRRI